MKLPLLSSEAPADATLIVKLTVALRERAHTLSDIIAAPTVLHQSTIAKSLVNGQVVNTITEQGDSWSRVLARLDILLKLGDQLAEVSMFYPTLKPRQMTS